jgi:hypothetical protein
MPEAERSVAREFFHGTYCQCIGQAAADLRIRGTTLRVVKGEAVGQPYGKFLPLVSGSPIRTTSPARKKSPSSEIATGNS